MDGIAASSQELKSKDNLPSSFRDPSGFVYEQDGQLLRQINARYQREYDYLDSSGVYQRLIDAGLLIQHEEVLQESRDGAYKIIQPESIPFVSFPYEWSFSQLKDAALTTLAVQQAVFDQGLVLRDASAYNIQFRGSVPVLIDSLSFGFYEEGKPWAAYRQFCQHFLAPLALASSKGPEMLRLLQTYIDGLPLNVAVNLMPPSVWLNPGLLMHLKLHTQAQQKYANDGASFDKKRHELKLSQDGFAALIDNLAWTIKSLKPPRSADVWLGYEQDNNYSATASSAKKELVEKFLRQIRPNIVWDLGSNTGEFSRIARACGAYVISVDGDPFCVDTNYQREKASADCYSILPLVMDLSAPSPSIGWSNEERPSLLQRGPCDLALALALIHHLAIANNVPLSMCAGFFARTAKRLIIEFVPKDDSQVQRMLTYRQDIFDQYTQDEFEKAFTVYFEITERVQVQDSKRWIYLMSAR